MMQPTQKTRSMAVMGMIGALLVLIAGPLNRFGVVPWQLALALFAVGALIAGLGAAWSLTMLARGRRGRTLVAGAVFGALGFAVLVAVIVNGRDNPAIHDISTDPANPPQFVAITPGLRGSGANTLVYDPATATAQQAAYPAVKPMMLAMPMDEAFRKALASVQARGWQIVAAVPAEGRIEATATAPWWGFKDDVVLRLTPLGEATRVDMRSVSRVGQGDFGANAKRIETLATAIKS